MNSILSRYEIPTGYLFVGDYEKGLLETLSIGDYGKHHNVKADFLGYTRDLNGVENTYCMPLSEKWVVTLSTQYGCPMRCTFCDVPKVQWRGNASVSDLKNQLYNALSLFHDVKYTERLNIHFARMGEPIFNESVFSFTRWMYLRKSQIQEETGIRIETLHPVLTTSLPRKLRNIQQRILNWCEIKNDVYNGQAGLQFSINSTDEEQRHQMFSGMSLTLDELSEMAKTMPDPVSRKYCLNFAFSTDFKIDADKLVSLFSPDKFMVKITPIHNNNACKNNNIKTVDGYNSFYPYRQAEEDLKRVGFDVLVFIPSMDEENGLVTCGNAILGSSKMKLTNTEIKIRGIEN